MTQSPATHMLNSTRREVLMALATNYRTIERLRIKHGLTNMAPGLIAHELETLHKQRLVMYEPAGQCARLTHSGRILQQTVEQQREAARHA